jgi:Xaa-Pro aminopeptidase
MKLFAERRRRLLEAIDGVVIIAAAPVTIRNNDVEHEYRQDSDFYYLTGFEEPNSVLILSTAHPEHQSVVLVRKRDPEREQWDGARAGVEGAKDVCGVDASFAIGELARRLPDYLSGAKNLYYELGRRRDIDELVLAALHQARGKGRSPKAWPTAIHHPEPLWHEMRLRKGEAELVAMRKAAAVTGEAHIGAMALAAPGKHEYEVEALFREVFRRHGCPRPAYTPIVGSGPNATVLHYNANNRQMAEGELLLIDAGCEFDYYASDVTRTFPVSNGFSDPQKQIYEVVLEAQRLGIEETKPGSNVETVHKASLHALIDGMLRIGLLEGSRDEVLEKESYRRYFMHRTSHWLGMDVHDVGAYFVDGKPRPFGPGMIITVEPGIYVSGSDEQAPEKFRGIGVRIEDDVLVTAGGNENLTAAIPKAIDDVERACRG